MPDTDLAAVEQPQEQSTPQEPVQAPPAPPSPSTDRAQAFRDEFEFEFDTDGDDLPQYPSRQEARTPAPAAPAKPEPIRHPKSLTNLALGLGISHDVISRTPTEELDSLVYERQLAAQAYNHGRASAFQPPPQVQPDEVDLGIPKEDLELIDPAIVAVMKRQAVELKRLQAFHAQQAQVVAQRENETLRSKVDRLFESKSASKFGKGPGIHLLPNSPEFLRRRAVLLAMDSMDGDTEARFEKAVAAVYGAIEPDEDPKAELEVRKKRWNDSALSRPTSKYAKEPRGDKKAIGAIAKKLRELNIASEGVEEEYSGLPD